MSARQVIHATVVKMVFLVEKVQALMVLDNSTPYEVIFFTSKGVQVVNTIWAPNGIGHVNHGVQVTNNIWALTFKH